MYDLYDEPDTYVRRQLPEWARWALSLLTVAVAIGIIYGGVLFLIWLPTVYLHLTLIGVLVGMLVGLIRYSVFDN